MEIKVRDNFPEVMAALRKMRDDLGDKALQMALNKTIDKGKTEMTRAITSEYAVDRTKVAESLSVVGASARGGRFVATLWAMRGSRGRSWNVIRFVKRAATRAKAGRRRKGSQARELGFMFKKGGGLKVIEGAFIGNTGRTVFRRIAGTTMTSRAGSKGEKHREQIEPVQVINIKGMFNTRRINERVVRRIRAEFPVEFERAARQVLRRFQEGR